MTSPSYSNLSSPLLEHPSIRKVELVTAVAIGDEDSNMTSPSYSNLSTNDDKVELVTAVAIGDAANHRSSISPIPEALDLTWTDTFYDSTEGVIAVFDIDYSPNRVGFRRLLRLLCSLDVNPGGRRVDQNPWSGMQTERGNSREVALYVGIFMLYIIFWVIIVCVEVRRRRRGLDRMHVAVTNEGIRKDFPIGAAAFLTTVVIPFEEIKAIYYRCGSSIVTVRSSVDRASDFIGLLDPEAFIALVNAMMARSHTVSVLDEESLTEK